MRQIFNENLEAMWRIEVWTEGRTGIVTGSVICCAGTSIDTDKVGCHGRDADRDAEKVWLVQART